MFQKFRSISDNELVLEYKKTHHEDVENELISRYKKNSKLLAGLLFSKYKFLYQVEFDDLYCILLGALFSSIRGFNNSTLDFYQYWRKTATNEVMNYVRSFSLEDNPANNYPTNPYNEEPSIVGYLHQNADNLNDDSASFELDEVFNNPKNKFDKKDIDLFNLYLGGYTISEITELTNLSYTQIRYRIRNVKRKLANILFNQ